MSDLIGYQMGRCAESSRISHGLTVRRGSMTGGSPAALRRGCGGAPRPHGLHKVTYTQVEVMH